MTLKRKIFISGYWTFYSLTKVGDYPKFDLRMTLADVDSPDDSCVFRDINGMDMVEGFIRVEHLSLEIKRLAQERRDGMCFEVTDIEADALSFKCASIEINGDDFDSALKKTSLQKG